MTVCPRPMYAHRMRREVLAVGRWERESPILFFFFLNATHGGLNTRQWNATHPRVCEEHKLHKVVWVGLEQCMEEAWREGLRMIKYVV